MTTLLVLIAIFWIIVITVLLTPAAFYTNTFDRITRARYRDDRIALQIMLDHLRSFPEQWSISRDAVSFPKEGSKQIYLNHDDKRGWNYTLNSFDSKPRPLAGHFESQFVHAITAENNLRESKSLIRNFYGQDGVLLLK